MWYGSKRGGNGGSDAEWVDVVIEEVIEEVKDEGLEVII